MHPMQALVDGMSAKWQRDRAQTRMTLGRLIEALEAMPNDAVVANLADPHSYRGYYCDLAFEFHGSTRPVSELLNECRESMGKAFTGYKGGDFVMGTNTPVWVADYGVSSDDRLVGISSDGSFHTQEDTD